jgi:hypothetical protein
MKRMNHWDTEQTRLPLTRRLTRRLPLTRRLTRRLPLTRRLTRRLPLTRPFMVALFIHIFVNLEKDTMLGQCRAHDRCL